MSINKNMLKFLYQCSYPTLVIEPSPLILIFKSSSNTEKNSPMYFILIVYSFAKDSATFTFNIKKHCCPTKILKIGMKPLLTLNCSDF